MNWYEFHYKKDGSKRRFYKARKTFWVLYLKIKFLKVKLTIRFERCPECNKIIINHGQNLSFDFYMEQKDCTYCNKCSEAIKL